MARAAQHRDLVTRPDRPGADDAQVGTEASGPGEPLDPTAPAHPLLEGHAGHAYAGDLDDDAVPARADPPPLADLGATDVEAADPQVLAEQARGDVARQLLRPPRRVLVGVGVERLVLAAVMPAVDLGVEHEPLGADLEAARARPLVDRRHVGGLAGVRDDLVDDAHRRDPAGAAWPACRARPRRPGAWLGDGGGLHAPIVSGARADP